MPRDEHPSILHAAEQSHLDNMYKGLAIKEFEWDIPNKQHKVLHRRAKKLKKKCIKKDFSHSSMLEYGKILAATVGLEERCHAILREQRSLLAQIKEKEEETHP